MMDIPRLHLIGPLGVVKPVEFLGIATRAAAGGCGAVHLRMRDLSGGDALRMARSMRRELAATPGTRLIINDRIDVALLSGADGVQLGERGFDVADARHLTGERMLIGRSIHDVDGAKRAAEAGASYLIAGHVFDTPSKEGEPGRGTDWLAEIASAVETPVIAIGGITLDNLIEVLSTGVYGIALGREFLSADDPKMVAERVQRTMEQEGTHGVPE
ncbi:MAG: thiamine phosphate synthase [Thermomicrobiales bacterium]